MYLILNIEQIDMYYITFLEPKENNIVNGTFTKLFFSDNKITMNGLYLKFNPSKIQFIDPIVKKYSDDNWYKPKILETKYKQLFQFDPISNIDYFNYFFDLEKKLLQYYLEYNNIKKQAVYVLKNQLMSGTARYYREHIIPSVPGKKTGYYLKISGIWETKQDVGITYKIIEYVYDINN